MKVLEIWFKKKASGLMIFLIVLCISLTFFFSARFGNGSSNSEISYTVEIEHYGVDASEIERSITVPLEDGVNSINGIDELRSVTEYGKCRLIIFFKKNVDTLDVYLDIRNAVETVYQTLPQSVQKPRINSSTSSRKCVFATVVKAKDLKLMNADEFIQFAEKKIKPLLEKLEGSGEVEVGGYGNREILIEVDSARLSQMRTNISQIARMVVSQDISVPSGIIYSDEYEKVVFMSGCFKSIDTLKEAKIPSDEGSIRLGSFATINYSTKEPSSLSRIDSNEEVVIYLIPNGNANLIDLCKNARSVLDKEKGISYEIILDLGKVNQEAIYNIVGAMIQSIFLIILILPFFMKDFRKLLIVTLSLPLTVIFSIAVLSLLKIELSQAVLCGIAVGLGSIADTIIIVTELKTFNEYEDLIKSLFASLISSLIVLFPLLFSKNLIDGMDKIAIAIMLLLSMSFFISTVFIPFLSLKVDGRGKYKKLNNKRTNTFLQSILVNVKNIFIIPSDKFVKIVSKIKKVLLSLSVKSYKRARLIFIFSLVSFVVTAFFAVTLGKDFQYSFSDNVFSLHLEFESGASLQSVDRRCVELSSNLKKIEFFTMIETNAKSGSAEVSIKFDSTKIKKQDAEKNAVKIANSIQGCFAYLPEGEGIRTKNIEVAISGDNDEVLRAIAKDACKIIGESVWAKSTVLNFKDAPKMIEYRIDFKKAALALQDSESISTNFRWALFGPVAFKRIENEKEYDVRIQETNAKRYKYADLEKIIIGLNKSGFVRAGDVGNFTYIDGDSKRYRQNRQKAVYFTVQAEDISTSTLIDLLWKDLDKVEKPSGYAFKIAKSIMKLEEDFRELWVLFIVCILLLYIVLTCLSESLTYPIAALCVVPFAILLPLLYLFLCRLSITVPIIIGFILLTGMSVNASILILDEAKAFRKRTGADIEACIAQGFSERLNPLLITVLMTSLGMIPLLFANGGSSFMNDLALTVFLGIIATLFATVGILPACIKIFPKSI